MAQENLEVRCTFSAYLPKTMAEKLDLVTVTKSSGFAGHWLGIQVYSSSMQLFSGLFEPLQTFSSCSTEVCKLFQCTAACKEIFSFFFLFLSSFTLDLPGTYTRPLRTERLCLLITANDQTCYEWQ